MNLKKLDRRNTGHSIYKYMASFRKKDYERFCEIRNWCWEQWGPSCELEFSRSRNYQWAWAVNEFETRIYIFSEKEYQWFLLRWHD